ncbi:MAG TPA: 50S ribosomal protein L22 [Bacteroidetes bacterium]|nr:50S ribosomal protein L22 [Bacteroidota bacterium]
MAQAKAVLNNVPSSPRKMRYVVDMIRGVDVDKALNILKFSTKHPARQIEKLLVSATSNWTAKNEGLNPEDAQLFVKEVFVNGGVTLKRWLPAPQGRAYRLRKRSNHVTLIVDSRVAPETAEVETVETEEAPVAEVVETAPKKKASRKKSSDNETSEQPVKKTTRKTKKAE